MSCLVRCMHPRIAVAVSAAFIAAAALFTAALTSAVDVRAQDTAGVTSSMRAEFPLTDFSSRTVPLTEFLSGGPPRDGIPPIDDPRFAELGSGNTFVAALADREPVVSVALNGDARAYPLRILMWHEIVNDEIGGIPVTVTYCPLCNTAISFDRRLDGPGSEVMDFGTTGRLRHSDLVMYDRQTETWWQQFTGEGLVGKHAGRKLTMVASRLESFGRFRERHPDGSVLVPTNPGMRDYGRNPYTNYDAEGGMPFLYSGAMPAGVEPMSRVVAYETGDGHAAITLAALRAAGRIETGDLVLTWEEGQASALDAPRVSAGRDVGNVVVQQRRPDGTMRDAVHDVTFAFAFHAFRPDAPIHTSAP